MSNFGEETSSRGFDDEDESENESEMSRLMERLRIFVAKEPIIATSLLFGSIGIFLPLVVRPILDSFETAEPVQPPALDDVVAGITGKKVQ